MTALGAIALAVYAAGWIVSVRPVARHLLRDEPDWFDGPRDAAAVAIIGCCVWPLIAVFWLIWQLARVFAWDQEVERDA